MTNVYIPLAAEGSHNPLWPTNYDMFWSAVSLIVILILFVKFVLPEFQAVLAEREDRIKGGIQRAEAAQAEAKAALEKYNAQLSDARTEAAQIREEAREKGKAIVTEMKADANEESARIVQAGEKQLLARREQIVSELQAEMSQNSINLAERLLGEQLADGVKRSATIDSFLSSLDDVTPTRK